ncbi:MAG: hypothetical protein AAGK98_18370 [Pseudomonadota bacterium]
MVGASGDITLSGPASPDGSVTWALTVAADPLPHAVVEWDGPWGGLAVAYAQLGFVPAVMWMARVAGEDR